MAGQAGNGLFVLFAAGERPSADDIERLLHASDSTAPARISHRGSEAAGRIELLASGLTFDLAGLPPSDGAAIPEARHYFGLPQEAGSGSYEALSLVAGGHLAGGAAMLPVVRTMCGVAAHLARAGAALAVCWGPAGSWMDCNYFSRVVAGWLAGGPFPALGLTGIEAGPDGAAQSDGLAWFIGQELRVETRMGQSSADTVKLAVRMMDHLVRHGAIRTAQDLVGPDGEPLQAEPSADGRLLRLRRAA